MVLKKAFVSVVLIDANVNGGMLMTVDLMHFYLILFFFQK